MESVSDYILQQAVSFNQRIDEDELMRKLANGLENGGDIDFIFSQPNFNRKCLGTILHFSVMNRYERVVEYALSRGANVASKMLFTKFKLRHQNAVEVAVKGYCSTYEPPIFEMLKKRSFELYSSFGLTSLHVDCVLPIRFWSDESRRRLLTADVNATISSDSPFWPGMTLLLIAAKLENNGLVRRLLNLGADPTVRDPDGNTPLHYAILYDERLFALDARNTFGTFAGLSHFHIACRRCPEALSIVKRYLEQGISPETAIKRLDCEVDNDAGKVGLHIAADKNCQELARLLLEHGAKVDQKDSKGRTPVEYVRCSSNSVAILGTLIEAGSNQERLSTEGLLYILSRSTRPDKLDFLFCLRKLCTLNKNLVSKNLKECYAHILAELADYSRLPEYILDFHEHNCLKELKALTDLGLAQILDETVIVKGDFKENFDWIDSFDFSSYPIYEKLLSLRFKRKLVEYERKRKCRQAVPLVQQMFLNQGHLPYLCAETILWHMSDEEVARLLEQL